MDLFKNNASEKQVIMSRLDNALESVRIEREFADIRRSMLQAVQNDMPFLPIRDWLRRFKFPFFISSYDSTHIQIIEDGSTEVKQLAEILGYRYTDVNGYALKCNGEKSYSPFIKESVTEDVNYDSLMNRYGDDIENLSDTIYQQMQKFIDDNMVQRKE